MFFFFERTFSDYQEGFRKECKTQPMLVMTEKIKITRENKQVCPDILSHLSKVLFTWTKHFRKSLRMFVGSFVKLTLIYKKVSP